MRSVNELARFFILLACSKSNSIEYSGWFQSTNAGPATPAAPGEPSADAWLCGALQPFGEGEDAEGHPEGEERMEVLEQQPPPQPTDRPRTTTRYMTKYERARILGTRALQIRCVPFACQVNKLPVGVSFSGLPCV